MRSPGDWTFRFRRSSIWGDSGVDMTTAARAGICPVGALWGFREEGELRKHGAIEIVKRPEELLGLLG